MTAKLQALLRSKTACLGLFVVLFWLACAIFAPVLAPYDPIATIKPLMKPGTTGPGGQFFLLGSDMLGRDILSRLIWGARSVVLWAGLATLAAYAVGIVMGLAAGYFRGATDRILSYTANVVLSFPVLILYLLIITRFGASGLNIVLAVTFASAPAVFRIVRALTLDLRERDFVRAAITQGEGPIRIMALDILPNAAGPLVVDACLRLGYTAITIGVLGFLGLGLPPPTPDWGGMINEGRKLALAFPHLVIVPSLAISSLMLGLSLFADGLREAERVGPVAGHGPQPVPE